ncbi:ATP-binding protein [Vibrio pomeroyi]|uniref:ATP-binding protein n=1 Tax=Vibrio pomeroyi TaxID=198832 RepID=UPI0021C3C6CA|nr:ATP-binding protein [Vibrio pomeroyi]
MSNAGYQLAKSNLTSSDQMKRFESAVYFSNHTHTDMKKELEATRRTERVRHIKLALDKALYRLSNSSASNLVEIDQGLEGEQPEDLRKHLKNQAIDEFSGVILHELAPKLGLLNECLKSEIGNYEASQAKLYIDRLNQIFCAIESLRMSTHEAESIETDLSQLIRNIVHEEVCGDMGISVSLEGAQPCIINSDPDLLTLALSNAIRNSCESLLMLKEVMHKTLTVSWGRSDKDSWISVIDNGIGFQGDPKAAFKIGNTSKQGHTGFGMGIMQQAMDNIGGYAELSNVETGGAKLLLRWGNF